MREQNVVKIVLTGGPCGGKTSSLEILKTKLSNKGYNVMIVQEVATDLMQRGISSETLGRENFQKKVLKWQIEKEQIYIRKLQEMNQIGILICDRGTLDGKAFCEMYWDETSEGISGEELFNRIVENLGLSEEELYSRYDKVIHFLSTAVDLPNQYNLYTNTIRQEDVRQSIEADEILQRIWSVHPERVILDNSTSFCEKVDRAVDEILSYVKSIREQQSQKKGEDMEELISEEKAMQIMNEYCQLLMEYEELGVLGVFLVGSLADGNYVPGKSDLDVSVVIKNSADIDKIKKISDKIIEILVKKHHISIDFEAFIKKEEMLYEPYYPEQQKTVELMRIRNQAKLLGGSFEQSKIPIPHKSFFIADVRYAEDQLIKKNGQDFISNMSAKQKFNYIVNFMRLSNFLNNNEFQFNKKEIIATYFSDEKKIEHMIQIMEAKDKSPYSKDLMEIATLCRKKKKQLFQPDIGENNGEDGNR